MNLLGSKKLITDRLELRAQTMEEQHYLWEVLMMDEVNKYYLTVPRKYRDKLKDWDKQEEYYREDIKHANDPDSFHWSIFIKDTNECIGRISAHEAHSEFEEINDPSIRGVGWYIDPKHQGKGYATEAAQAMIDYLFNEVEINGIVEEVTKTNVPSWKIMEKLGFERTNKTTIINYTFLDEPVEGYIYQLTKEMYFNKKNRHTK